ncbi:hypothetical protein JCM30237_26530 [Halolamina litorea]|uniref:Big-1 domain-containing protein n=1 Tax=Halolamina litorea TaxID=1515593 RepID=A0ABD6BN97_9EURY|nr:hypothetical protein [Halolamina litorea]
MLRGDDRAQSVQVGAILLFGILIVALATAQATVIPQQNAAIEFDHSRAVQSDMQDLRNSLVRAADGDGAPTRVDLGITYPTRLLFINPPPATGRLRTVGAENPDLNVTVGNASGSVTVGSDYENARAYWATAGVGTYNTSAVVYQPNYREYGGSPTTVYGNSVLYNTFDNGANRTLTGQRLIQGNTIDLLALRGDLRESGATTKTVDVETLSERRRTVTVESEAGDPLFVNVTSRLSADVWNDDLLGSNAAASDAGSVTIDGVEYHRIAIELDPGTYRLRGAAVGVGAVSDTERERATDPAYMVVTDGYDVISNESGETGTITVEVRDRFNNPVTGATVNADADGTYLELVDGPTFETNAEGEATIEYRSVGTTAGDASINVSIGAADYEQANFTGLAVPAFDLGGGDGGGGELNPGTTGDLIYTSAALNAGGSGSETVDMSFNNTLSEDVNITSIRVNFFYDAASPPGSPPSTAEVRVTGGSPELRASSVDVGGNYRSIDPNIVVSPGGPSYQFTLDFDVAIREEDFFVFTLVFEYGGEVYRETYFANPQ